MVTTERYDDIKIKNLTYKERFELMCELMDGHETDGAVFDALRNYREDIVDMLMEHNENVTDPDLMHILVNKYPENIVEYFMSRVHANEFRREMLSEIVNWITEHEWGLISVWVVNTLLPKWFEKHPVITEMTITDVYEMINTIFSKAPHEAMRGMIKRDPETIVRLFITEASKLKGCKEIFKTIIRTMLADHDRLFIHAINDKYPELTHIMMSYNDPDGKIVLDHIADKHYEELYKFIRDKFFDQFMQLGPIDNDDFDRMMATIREYAEDALMMWFKDNTHLKLLGSFDVEWGPVTNTPFPFG